MRSPSRVEIDTLSRLFHERRLVEAEALSKALTVRFPRHGFGWKVLGAIHQAQERYEDALQATRQALRLLPGDAAVHNNMGNSLLALDRFDEAEASYRHALTIAPDYAKALSNLGSMLNLRGRLAEAEACCRRALALDPQYAKPHGTLALILFHQGATPESVSCYRAALAIDPSASELHSQMLFCLSHNLQIEANQLHAEHLAFAERFEPPLRAAWQLHPNSKDPGRRLQVGFVSGDLCDHAMASYIAPLLQGLATKPGLSLHAYYTQTRDDAVTRRLQTYFSHWHAVAHLSEAALAEQIRADNIDILIDLSGHTADNRALTFARKPAPIQASWLGYLGTSGLQAVDYYFCDRFWLPPGELDWQLTEKPVFLPCSVVFEPSPAAPPVNPLPALSCGHITFGSFNRPTKLNTSVIALWSMLLREIPSSRMLLGNIPAENQTALLERFAQAGIAPERLLLRSRTPLRDYLALHQQVDLCLDTFPYGGGSTTAQAAWMGVPTLSLMGDTPASRFGATEMHHLGLDAFIATSIEDFVDKGRHWAGHPSDLAAIRSGLRSRLAASSLGQAEAFANHFEAALRAMWQRWCADLPRTSITVEASSHQVQLK